VKGAVLAEEAVDVVEALLEQLHFLLDGCGGPGSEGPECCCGPGMPVGPEVASDRDDVEAKTADLGLVGEFGLDETDALLVSRGG